MSDERHHVQPRSVVEEGLPTSSDARVNVADLVRANADKDDLLARERRLRKQLEEAHVAKDRLLAILSHDLRAPLNAVLGWTQLMRRERLDHMTRDRALATIERNARSQLRLIDELLDISRNVAGRAQLERAQLDLTELVRRAADAVTVAARDAGVVLSVATPAGPLFMAGDRGRIEQSMANLLSNALKFTPSGGRITLSVERQGHAARLVVEDNGRGIGSELLPIVFEPSQQAADYTASSAGLGLYIVRQAVEMHGGTVTAESDGPGKGARFTLTLPLLGASDTSTSAPAAAASKARLRPANELHGIRVLVVDEEEDARELMATMLRQRGATVVSASDVATAFSAFDESTPDVVVSHIGMRAQSGLDLVRALRKRAGAMTAFVAVTGYAAPEEIARAFDAGFDVHVAKPIEPSELAAVVRDASRSHTR